MAALVLSSARKFFFRVAHSKASFHSSVDIRDGDGSSTRPPTALVAMLVSGLSALRLPSNRFDCRSRCSVTRSAKRSRSSSSACDARGPTPFEMSPARLVAAVSAAFDRAGDA